MPNRSIPRPGPHSLFKLGNRIRKKEVRIRVSYVIVDGTSLRAVTEGLATAATAATAGYQLSGTAGHPNKMDPFVPSHWFDRACA